jgi:hypothetical protein
MNKDPENGKNKGGRPRDPRITELEQKLSVTRRRAAQILKEEATGDLSSDELRKLRARKLDLECQRIEFELEKVKTSLEWLPVERFNEGILNFVTWSRLAFCTYASENAGQLAGENDERKVQDSLAHIFKNCFLVGSIGYMSSHGFVDPRLIQNIRQQIQCAFNLSDAEIDARVAAIKNPIL